MSELIKRTVSGTLFVACVVGSIIWNPFAFSGLFFLFCIMAVDEFHRLVKSPRALRVFSFVATVVVWMTMQLLALKGEDGGQYRSVSFIIAMSYLPIVVIALLDEIWNHSGKPLQNWGNFLISQVMIAMPLATLLLLNFLSKWLLLALFVLIWVNDTGAYCVGSLTAKRKNGNHKMTPHISPKKSWEGLIGGFVFTLGAAVLLHRFGWFDEIIIPRIQWLIVLGFAFLVSAFGTMGDLMESLFKRSLGVKDSGAFLPGHGGVLDRFDSVLLASPIITAFCYICYFLLPLV